MEGTDLIQLTPRDFKSDQEVRWCPGCGNHAVMSAVQKALSELGIPREKFAFVSGIGCSSRFPYYMNTYGFHGIHGRAAAIATGVQTSSGELIITTDADCRTDKSWVGTIASFYEKYNSDMIICPVILGRGKGFFGKFQELEFLSLQGITTASAAAGRGTMCNGANLAFKREAYLKHAGNLHDEIPSGDDIFFLHSLKNERGARIFWLESPEATVTTSQAGTPSSFIKQRRRWISKGKAYNDRFTILLAVVTFVTILAQVLSMLAGIVKPVFLMPFAAIFILKSVPDLLILGNTTGRYGRRDLLKWFLPSQLVYPFYVMSVTLSVAGGMIKRRI